MIEFGMRYGFSIDKFVSILTMTYKTFTNAKNLIPLLNACFTALVPKLNAEEKNGAVGRYCCICK